LQLLLFMLLMLLLGLSGHESPVAGCWLLVAGC